MGKARLLVELDTEDLEKELLEMTIEELERTDELIIVLVLDFTLTEFCVSVTPWLLCVLFCEVILAKNQITPTVNIVNTNSKVFKIAILFNIIKVYLVILTLASHSFV